MSRRIKEIICLQRLWIPFLYSEKHEYFFYADNQYTVKSLL